MRPLAILLVGLPGAGKSTYRKEVLGGSGIRYAVASSDDYLDWIAERNQTTYNDVFESFIKEADKHFHEQIALAVANKENLIIDRVNMSIKTRAKLINVLKKTHDIQAVIFEISDEDLFINLAGRVGKRISLDIINRMKHTYILPTKAEGIDYIDVVKFSRK